MLGFSLEYKGMPVNIGISDAELVIHVELDTTYDYTRSYDYSSEDVQRLYELLEPIYQELKSEGLLDEQD